MQFQYLYETTGLTGVVLSVVWYILILAAGWKMYEKANEPGWKSIIPIYNTYTCYKFTWDTKIFWIYILCTALGEVLPSLLGSLVSLAATVLMIVQLYKLSKAFGQRQSKFLQPDSSCSFGSAKKQQGVRIPSRYTCFRNPGFDPPWIHQPEFP